jgi:hypothetical protein
MFVILNKYRWKRLKGAKNDLARSVPLVGFPFAVAVAGFALNFTGTLGQVCARFSLSFLLAILSFQPFF